MSQKGNDWLCSSSFPSSSEWRESGPLDDLMEQRCLASLWTVREKHLENIVFWVLFVIAASTVPYVTHVSSESPSWLGSSLPQTVGRPTLPSSVWSRWRSLFDCSEAHVLFRDAVWCNECSVCWRGGHASASLTALPLAVSPLNVGLLTGPLWAAASAPLKCRWSPLQQDCSEDWVRSSV